MILTEESYQKVEKLLGEIILFAANGGTPEQVSIYLLKCGYKAVSIKQILREGISFGGDDGGAAA